MEIHVNNEQLLNLSTSLAAVSCLYGKRLRLFDLYFVSPSFINYIYFCKLYVVSFFFIILSGFCWMNCRKALPALQKLRNNFRSGQKCTMVTGGTLGRCVFLTYLLLGYVLISNHIGYRCCFLTKLTVSESNWFLWDKIGIHLISQLHKLIIFFSLNPVNMSLQFQYNVNVLII